MRRAILLAIALATPVCGKSATIAVAPSGSDAADGTLAHPFRSLARAQQAVRVLNREQDVTVLIGDGVYPLEAPLMFGPKDGGQNGHQVIWAAAENAHPVISGGINVSGWHIHDAGRHIWVAQVPAHFDSRELWVDDRLAQRAQIEISRDKVAFSADGLTVDDPAAGNLAALPNQNRIEVEGTAEFTDRFAVVSHVAGKTLTMQQPGWQNNLWGYDTLTRPGNPKRAKLFLVNALAFLSRDGQWYLDPAAGRLYYRPLPGQDMSRAKAVLPRLPYLVSVGGTPDALIHDLSFKGLRFSYTSWLGPSSAEGYANQQSGSFMTGKMPVFPSDALTQCGRGCPQFEQMRNLWSQIPAAIQVSAARRIAFDGNVFAHLGQIGLGIGNDPNATATGVGYGTTSISVTRNVFFDLAGGAILAGGIQRDAHHPRAPWQMNRFLTISNNRIRSVSKDYKDNAAVLSTYVLGALIVHNDISDATYDGIDIGWGWGLNDAGGNPAYLTRERGYYDDPANLIYDTPTPHREVMVAYNVVHDVKQWFRDGGTIYNLSASPGTVIAENYLYNIGEGIGLYLDEGSRGLTLRNNVVDGGSLWLFANTIPYDYPMRITVGNRAVDNWHDHTASKGWDSHSDNRIENDHVVPDKAWPEEARKVIANAGIEPSAGSVAYGDAR